MDCCIYLTDNLLLEKNQLYYEKGEQKIPLQYKNWHHYLGDYDWEKLSLGWKRRLKSTLSPKNSLWGIKDCGGSGDCLFLCLEEALKNLYEPEDDFYSISNLRNMAADQITPDNFTIILETYKAEKDSGEFDGDWDPRQIHKIEELQSEIKKLGNSFWGDHIIIQLLSEALKINIMILNDENEHHHQKYRVQPTFSPMRKDRRTVILSYYSNCHYQLIGYFNGNKMMTLFNWEQIPSEFKKVLRDDLGNI